MPLRHNAPLLVLRRKPRLTGWLGLGWRIAVMLGLLLLLILIHWLERDGLKDTHDGSVSLVDVIYFTMISATTTGYGDIVPVTDKTRLFDALIVSPIRIAFLFILAGSAYAFVARRSWEKFVMKKIQRNLCDHIVVAGYGPRTAARSRNLSSLAHSRTTSSSSTRAKIGSTWQKRLDARFWAGRDP